LVCPVCEKKVSPSLTICPHCYRDLGNRTAGRDRARLPSGRRSQSSARKRSSDQILLWGVAGVLAAGLVGAGWWAITPFWRSHETARAQAHTEGLTARKLYRDARESLVAGKVSEAISRAQIALNILQDSEKKDLEIPIRELLARAYGANGDTVAGLLQWRSLVELAPDVAEYRQMVAKVSGQFNVIGLSVAAGDLQQAEDLFRTGDQPEGIRRARLAVELYKEHAGSRSEMARSEAILGQMLWKRKELARARDCLEQAALLGYADPTFLRVLSQSRQGQSSEKVVHEQLRSNPPRLPLQGNDLPGADYPTSQRKESPELSGLGKSGHRLPAGRTVGMGPIGGPSSVNVRPRQHQPHLTLPSVRVPDSVVRGGGLPTYDHPYGRADVLPSYDRNSSGSGGLPGYKDSGLHPASDRLPTY
jgi:tetratricopeptide (TPR) repeat protein